MSEAMKRVWLVTGANSGFGQAIVEAAIAAGDVVVATARRPSVLDDLVGRYPGQVDSALLDMTDASGIEATVKDVLRRHGRIDVLVNNAGRTHAERSRRRPTPSSDRSSRCTFSARPP